MNIAIVGSAPSSSFLVPAAGPWEVWACSPGTIYLKDKIDVFFELHRYEPGQEWFSEGYCEFLRNQKRLWVSKKVAGMPYGKEIPYKRLVKKYGPYFFTSSIAWMLAMAIEKKPEKISLWGVDMAATTEYFDQKLGCQYFALLAKSQGIEIGVPPESDLFRPLPPYGLCQHQHSWIKHQIRQTEMQTNLDGIKADIDRLTQEKHFFEGVLDDLDYNIKTWVGIVDCDRTEM